MDVRRQSSTAFYCGCLSTLFLISAAYFFIWSTEFVVTDYKEIESRIHGSEPLPKGIISKTSDLEMHQLWGTRKKKSPKLCTNLVAMAVGIKQKESVNKIIKKFLSSSKFVVMLFHYDGIVNEWRDLEWSDHAVHVSAINQTKWWFAKRFLHPDIVSEYAYIFLWDEHLGVENFNVARKVVKMIGGRKCDESSTEPPCTGWIEMMAPVFSLSSWRCTWHIIQNDLVHAWGLDFQLGYCARANDGALDRVAESVNLPNSEQLVHNQNQAQSHSLHVSDARSQVRKQSFIELEIFKNRWKKAVKEDHCWKDPYQKTT